MFEYPPIFKRRPCNIVLFYSCLLSTYLIQRRKCWHRVISLPICFMKTDHYSSKRHDEAHHNVSFEHKESKMCKGNGMHWFHAHAACSLIMFVKPLYVDIINLNKNRWLSDFKNKPSLFEAQFTSLLGNCHVAHTIKWLTDKTSREKTQSIKNRYIWSKQKINI